MRLLTSVDIPLIATVIAYLCAAFSAALLFRRTHHWRLKFISAVVTVLPLYQAVIVLRDSGRLRLANAMPWLANVELIISGLFLTAVLLLNLECKASKCIDVRLRLAEADGGWRQMLIDWRKLGWLRHWTKTTGKTGLPRKGVQFHEDGLENPTSKKGNGSTSFPASDLAPGAAAPPPHVE